MTHALYPPELNPAQLAVLLNELVEGEQEMEAAIVIAQGRAQMIQMALEEEERHQEPTRVEGYVEQVVPLYSNQEFKAHFRMEKTTFEVKHILKRNLWLSVYYNI